MTREQIIADFKTASMRAHVATITNNSGNYTDAQRELIRTNRLALEQGFVLPTYKIEYTPMKEMVWSF